MAVLAIAGSGRGAGKTAVGCALIQAIPELRWVAVKASPHRHGMQEGVWEETVRDSEKDTGRYLRAGAERSWLVSAVVEQRADGAIRDLRPEGTSLLIESNQIDSGSIAELGEAVVSLAVLAGPVEDWKPSLAARLAAVDALVITVGATRESLPMGLTGKRTFLLPQGQWVAPDLVRLVYGSLVG